MLQSIHARCCENSRHITLTVLQGSVLCFLYETKQSPKAFQRRTVHFTMVKNLIPHKSKHAPGESVYERYLRTEELLSLQKPESELVHHDELQFQVVHQVFELWWKEAAFELRTIHQLLQQFDVPPALRLL